MSPKPENEAVDPKDEAVERRPEAAGPRVKWDDSEMRSFYANVCNVTSTREEVTVLFGMNQTWYTGQEEVRVKLSDRIILSPFAAKRLFTLLGRVIKEYEELVGPIPLEPRVAMDPEPKG
ncbi:MAG: DUF3467 domain-containing protein [bacterium]|nr:DUF3467 domain-containing protein [bacterium]